MQLNVADRRTDRANQSDGAWNGGDIKVGGTVYRTRWGWGSEGVRNAKSLCFYVVG